MFDSEIRFFGFLFNGTTRYVFLCQNGIAEPEHYVVCFALPKRHTSSSQLLERGRQTISENRKRNSDNRKVTHAQYTCGAFGEFFVNWTTLRWIFGQTIFEFRVEFEVMPCMATELFSEKSPMMAFFFKKDHFSALPRTPSSLDSYVACPCMELCNKQQPRIHTPKRRRRINDIAFMLRFGIICFSKI